MTDLQTERLVLHPVDVDEAERIIARQAGAPDSWAEDFPFDGDVVGATFYLRACAERGSQPPFGFYRLTRLADGRAIGGIGFKAPPVQGHVEIGYGLAPSARGQGLASEAVMAIVDVARTQKVTKVLASTTHDNIASQRTLFHAGFTVAKSDDEMHYYEIDL
ncbi:MAG TPA: GNAT family N-acetyltransferase [Acidimicrobiales bacterium]|nr:MAG: hypothetical protein B7X07_04440 [Actinobacteria bacterium 21-64-8]HQU00034.1 GNAT family N-acetyltransferase [Acidimicrobiales bacterium]